jgi:nitrite reductase/ring-hydroxylating ferredoxin subunit
MSTWRRVSGAGRLANGWARKVQFVVDGPSTPLEIVLCRVDGKLFALDSLCPHEGGRIADGPLSEGRIAFCPLHLYHFDPRDGRNLEGDCPHARTLRVREIGEDAEVWV